MFDLKVLEILIDGKENESLRGAMYCRRTIDWLGIVLVEFQILSISVIEAFKVQGQSCLVGLLVNRDQQATAACTANHHFLDMGYRVAECADCCRA